MSTIEPSPRLPLAGIITTWIIAAVAAVLIGLLAPENWRAAWMPVGMGITFIAAFMLQLASGTARGFIQRMSISVVGALIVMGLIGIGLGLATLFVG